VREEITHPVDPWPQGDGICSISRISDPFPLFGTDTQKTMIDRMALKPAVDRQSERVECNYGMDPHVRADDDLRSATFYEEMMVQVGP
jgi:hypothetical protein